MFSIVMWLFTRGYPPFFGQVDSEPSAVMKAFMAKELYEAATGWPLRRWLLGLKRKKGGTYEATNMWFWVIYPEVCWCVVNYADFWWIMLLYGDWWWIVLIYRDLWWFFICSYGNNSRYWWFIVWIMMIIELTTFSW